MTDISVISLKAYFLNMVFMGVMGVQRKNKI